MSEKAVKKPAAKRSRRATVPAAQSSGESRVTSTVVDVLEQPVEDVNRVQLVDLELIDEHPANPRHSVGDLTELADSIRVHGVQQNLVVVPHPEVEGRFRVVMGHRRRAAAVEAGLTQVPAVVRTDLSDVDQLALMLVENIQRMDLTVVEEGEGYQGLLDLGLTAGRIAKRTGRAPATVKSRAKIAKLPSDVKTAVECRQVTLEDAVMFADAIDKDPTLVEGHVPMDSLRHVADWVRTSLSDYKAEASWQEFVAKVREQYGVEPKVVPWNMRDAVPRKQVGALPGFLPRVGPDHERSHHKCPGHELWVNNKHETTVEWLLWVCTQPDLHAEALAAAEAERAAEEQASVQEREELRRKHDEALQEERSRREFVRDLAVKDPDALLALLDQLLFVDPAACLLIAEWSGHMWRIPGAGDFLWETSDSNRTEFAASCSRPARTVAALMLAEPFEDCLSRDREQSSLAGVDAVIAYSDGLAGLGHERGGDELRVLEGLREERARMVAAEEAESTATDSEPAGEPSTVGEAHHAAH